MGLGPVPAVKKLLGSLGLALGDFDLVEINEAFAAQVLACERELAWDTSRRNVCGGAIALGHPIGCTGAKITVTLLHALRREGKELGLATLCVSGGQGMALALRRI
jgi:acetyl-CoA C-acetyltransferase